MKVYLVQHARDLGDDREDVKVVGIYATEENAERAVRELASKPGFVAHPEGFHIDPYVVDQTYWADGFATI